MTENKDNAPNHEQVYTLKCQQIRQRNAGGGRIKSTQEEYCEVQIVN